MSFCQASTNNTVHSASVNRHTGSYVRTITFSTPYNTDMMSCIVGGSDFLTIYCDSVDCQVHHGLHLSLLGRKHQLLGRKHQQLDLTCHQLDLDLITVHLVR